jgi:pyruvate dehydrogenase E2 component (dihydrolipoamide acetyltransferase)
MTSNSSPDEFGPVSKVPLSRIQKIVAKRLSHSASTIPHVTHNDEVDITAVEELRKGASMKASGVTTLSFVIKALAAALVEFPLFNSSLSDDGERLILREYFNVGVAVDAPSGLVVPVIRDCDRKSVPELASELAELIRVIRSKGLPFEAMRGGCITVTSLGGIGGTSFTPIINSPEVAILGVTRAQIKPVWDGNSFQPAQLLPLSLSYDHRVINGADAARFVRRIGEGMLALAAEMSGTHS